MAAIGRKMGADTVSRDQLVTGELGGVPHDLFGIALSGGGIRSATFNLGLLQGMQKTGLLERADYLSTVSGGGYIGGFWSAWRHEKQQAGFPSADDDDGEESIRHLRRFSNFLSPRLGVFSYDTGRLAVAALTAAIPTILATFSFLVLVFAAWSMIALHTLTRSTLGVGAITALTVLVFTTFEATWVVRERRGSGWAYTIFATAALVLAMLILWLLPASGVIAARWTIPTPATAPDLGRWFWFQPAIAWAGAFLVLAFVRGAASRYARKFERVHARAALDRVLSRLLFLTGAWTALSVLWLVAMTLHAGTADARLPAAIYSVITTVVATAFVWSRRLGMDQPSKPFGSALAARLKPRIPQILGWAVLVLVVIATMTGVIRAADTPGVLAWTLGTAVAITLGTIVLFHPNRVGLHSFYRGRLARAYLGAARARSDLAPFTEEAEGDDIQLRDLTDVGPLHLISCTVNDLTPLEPLANFQRGGASAVLSRRGFAVMNGPDLYWTPWYGTSPTLGAAITASGAAFNSMMGSFSKRFGPAATFVLAMLNLRLGLWLRHPSTMHAPATHSRFRAWIEEQRQQFAPRSAKEWWLPGLLFYKELFGYSRADAPDVHLSDGGHFENTAVYELIRRRCNYIIAADCGADPDRAFDDVANLIRRVRQDFGAEIRIDLSPLYLDDRKCARQPMVAGDIHYDTGDVGVLLLFKPTLTGNEPPDILQYRTRNPRFPNESTGDQFYDEAQWESYRRLGEYAADTAFAFMRKSQHNDAPVRHAVDMAKGLATPTERRGGDEDARRIVGRLFSAARFEWLPKPPEFEKRMQRFVERAADIDLEIVGWLRRSVLMRDGSDDGTRPSGELPTFLADTSWMPQGKALDDALLALRRALLFMEETWYAWDLERTHAQPLSLGVMNYIGRWAGTPLMHVWWPLLKGLHSPPFTRFMERSFGLVGIQPSDRDDAAADVITETREPDPEGYAVFIWRITTQQADSGEAPGDPAYIGYHLRMMVFGRPVYSVQAAMLRAIRSGNMLWWDAADFFVPPGLWGIGIGEDFLQRMRQQQALDGTHHVVRIRRADNMDPDAAKVLADQLRMFRSAGFTDAGTDIAGGTHGNAWLWLIRRAPHGAPVTLQSIEMPG